jgi:hypothetical protein
MKVREDSTKGEMMDERQIREEAWQEGRNAGEHTPSTEVVRFTYTWFMWEDGYSTNDEAGHDESVAKFERWLAEVKEEAFKEGADSVNNQCSETNVGF